MQKFILPEIDVEFIVKNGPGYIYWKNIDSVYIGCNQNFATLIGLKVPEDIIGLHESSMPWSKTNPDTVTHNINADQKVMQSGQRVITEECLGIENENGLQIILRSEKLPLVDKSGEIVGILGVSVDIADTKEKERLAIENKVHEIALEQQNKFKKIVDQVVHDIRSPLASMQMILPLCDKISENLRVSLNKSATRISDIANNLLNRFQPEDPEYDINSEAGRLPTLISADLLEIITEKKYEYGNLPLDFIPEISQSGYFVFINVDARAFKRTLSNLINNAVEAFDGAGGEITISLDVFDDKVQIIITDNGNGMPIEIKEKILNNIQVTSGKADGHGIGFSQIREALANNNGQFDIESEVGVGTKVIITFPKVPHPQWIAEKIELYNDTFIVILDDDESIHGAWEARFKESAPNLQRKHFKEGNEAVIFINALESAERNKIFLLTDYELLRQDLHGLDVINKTGIRNSILVTSHYNNPEVRDLAKLSNTKILPKPLASEIPINKLDMPQPATSIIVPVNVDLVCIDDDKEFINVFNRFIANENRTMHTYFSVREFMNNITKYRKNTMILIDNKFERENITGIDLVKQLYVQGYENLYLFSGKDYSNDSNVPWYLTLILKTDIDKIKYILNKEA